jgi:hypothetical protein
MVITLTAAVLCALAGVLVPRAQAAPPPGWRIFTLFSARPYADLLTMTATWASNAWAFGDSAGPGSPPVALRWNGKTWTASRPFGNVTRPFYVSSTGGNNIWVTGQDCTNGASYVSAWNGSRWHTTMFRNAPFPFCQAPVVTTGQSNGWIFAKSAVNTQARHFNGKTWRTVTIGKFGAVLAASAVSAGDIWLLTETAATKMLVVHYNGRTWTSVRLPAVSLPTGEKPYAADIEAASGANVWAAAELIKNGQVTSGPETSLLLHWDGRTWHWITVPFDDIALHVAPDTGSVWVVAQTVVATGTGWDFLRWTPGNHWTRVPAPAAGIPGDSAAYELYTLTHIPHTHSFWASADADYAVGSTAKQSAVIFKYGP